MKTKVKKRLIGRLPANVSYKITNVYHSSIEDFSGCICDNCGKSICNVATVETSDNKIYSVGLDCASTLSNIDPLDLGYYNDLIKQGKSARASIVKFLKSKSHVKTKLEVKTFDTDKNFWKEVGAGGYYISVNYSSDPKDSEKWHNEKYRSYPKNTWQTIILPYIKDLVSINA